MTWIKVNNEKIYYYIFLWFSSQVPVVNEGNAKWKFSELKQYNKLINHVIIHTFKIIYGTFAIH